LHGRQAQTTFSHDDFPPREIGTTWSSESSEEENFRPQYWQRLLSRRQMLPRENFVGNENLSVRSADIVVCRLNRDVHPVLEVIRPIFGIDGADVPLVEKDQRPAHRGDLYCLEDPVEDEYVAVEHCAGKHTRPALLFPRLVAPGIRCGTSYNAQSCKNSSFAR
jgi:hypothetical protein